MGRCPFHLIFNAILQYIAMFDNFSSSSAFNSTSLQICTFIYHKQIAVHETSTLLMGVINASSALVAVAGNALVLAAIWRNPSLRRTPSYILLAGLAVTDFATGLISQPLYVAYIFLRFADKNERGNYIVITTADSLGRYFATITMVTITVMTFERWMYMSRRSLITVRRAYIIYGVLASFPIPFLAARLWLLSVESFRAFWEPLVLGILCAVCFITTLVSYCKVFRIIRVQHRQIQANQSFHDRPAITLKYKKSVYTVIYILVLFLLCYSPHVIGISVGIFLKNPFADASDVVWHVSATTILMSSSLNPLLYCWRIKEIQDEVKLLMRKFLCKG